MHLFSKKQILKGNTHSHRIPLLIQNNLGCCNSSCVTQNRIFVFMQGIQNSNIMQRGGTDIRASVHRASPQIPIFYNLQDQSLEHSGPTQRTICKGFLVGITLPLLHILFITQRISAKFCKFFQINLFLTIHPLQNIDLY